MVEIPIGLQITDPVHGIVYHLDSVTEVGTAASVLLGDFIEHEHGCRGDFPVLGLRYRSDRASAAEIPLDVRFTAFGADGAVLAPQDSAAGEDERDTGVAASTRSLAGYWPVLPGTTRIVLNVVWEPLGEEVAATIDVDLDRGTATW